MFFVPSTPGSKLLKMLRKAEETNKIGEYSRIKFIETSGRKFIDQLKINDQFGQNCNPSENCIVCAGVEKPSNCKVANVGYTLFCKLCKDRGVQKSYKGETCRSGYLRGIEHQRQFKNKSDGSVMYKHTVKDHPDEEEKVRFGMKIVGKFQKPMNRQIDEALRIKRMNPSCLLNSKSEFHGPAIRRKTLEGKTRNP